MKTPIKNSPAIYPELARINNLIFKPCKIQMQQVEAEAESHEYFAHQFTLNGKRTKFRVAKITPAKFGQFVTVWKRNDAGITAPFDISDGIECCVIFIRKEEKSGVFIFPKVALLTHEIIAGDTSNGKRGFRVYAPWDFNLNTLAKKTQQWQLKYFLNLSDEKIIEPDSAKRLLSF